MMVELAMDDSDIKIGQRIQVGNQIGTIAYVGPVPPTKGIWLGIDWDDPKRGKHDGVHNGIRYFQASYPTSGSLVRKEKVDFGQSVISAMKERYGGPEQIMDEKEKEAIQRAFNAPLFEMVGFEKLSNERYEDLAVVGLREHRVSSVEPDELAKFCPLVEEMDLSKNLINSWHCVFEIISQLPRLRFLDISENRLTYTEEDFEKFRSRLPDLKCLVLGKMEYTWEDIVTCVKMWPRLQKLQVSFNKITKLTRPIDVLQNLIVLNIEGNPINDWHEIAKLGYLPRLESLNVSEVGISKITIENDNLFPSLKYILLSENYINDWESISELDKLPSLEELRFRDNPILNGVEKEWARQIIIARISKLKILNTQEIQNVERKGAEYDYLKHVAKSILESANDDATRAKILSSNPRYKQLIEKYGEIEESEIATISTSLKSKLIEVKLQSNDTAIIKKLPPDMSIQRLISLSQRLFCTGSSTPMLTLNSSKNPDIIIPLEDNIKQLSFYSVEEGDTITVSW